MPSCAKLVALVTKNADLVDDGQLIVDVQAIDMNGNTITGATIPRKSMAQCGVLATGGRMLRGQPHRYPR